MIISPVKQFLTKDINRPAGDPDGVELGAEGVSVAVGVSVELVVVLELGLDLLAAGVVGVHVQLVGHLAREGEESLLSLCSATLCIAACGLHRSYSEEMHC